MCSYVVQDFALKPFGYVTTRWSVACLRERKFLASTYQHQRDPNVHCPQRVEYASKRLELRTAEAEAIEAEELQNTLNQPNDAGGASGAGGDAGGGRGVDGGDGQIAEDGSDNGGKGVIELRCT